MRVIKIARHIPGINKMLRMAIVSLKGLRPFAGILFLFIYIFSLIGRELFAYQALIDEDGIFIYGESEIKAYVDSGKTIRYPRMNFNTFF